MRPALLGRRIGNYQVVSQIGIGGMGVVYLANHDTLGRRVAVKVLLPELSHNRDIVARFFNEARAATAIRHPGIVEVFDFGYLEDASAYIVMELLEGESLAVRCKRLGRLEPGQAILLARQIAGALAAAHERGIVHRDLKPDNVFLVADPEVPSGERIKILDFGIAKLAAEPGDTSRTQTGSVLGTPTYMAPEQCRGAGTVDARADLYALGCLLYELVCGHPPFVVDGVGELIARHLYFEPAPPRQLDPTIPEPIEQLILWLLQKEPAARPAGARDFIDAVDRLDGGAGLSLPPRSAVLPAPIAIAATPTTLSGATGVRARRDRERRRRRWLIPAVALMTTAAGVVAWLAIAPGLASAPAGTAAPAAGALVEAPAPAPVAAPAPAPAVPAADPEPAADHVRLMVTSEPAGATVLLGGKPIGTTPFDEAVARGDGQRDYVPRRPGYEPAPASLDLARDGARHVKLIKKRRRQPHSLGDHGVNPFD